MKWRNYTDTFLTMGEETETTVDVGSIVIESGPLTIYLDGKPDALDDLATKLKEVARDLRRAEVVIAGVERR